MQYWAKLTSCYGYERITYSKVAPFVRDLFLLRCRKNIRCQICECITYKTFFCTPLFFRDGVWLPSHAVFVCQQHFWSLLFTTWLSCRQQHTSDRLDVKYASMHVSLLLQQ
ncbi:hypothetical protein FKM82_030147 [Ascaphus truei]